MRQLEFNGYLKWYIADISGQSSFNIHRLVKLTEKNYRLFDSLMLYCCLNNKKDIFNKYTKNKYENLVKHISKDTFLSKKYNEYDFQKIWEGYQHQLKRVEYDNNIKDKIRNNTIKVMEEKGITKYRIYTDLNLNGGNINDYLTNGNVSKVSLETAKKIYYYVRDWENKC